MESAGDVVSVGVVRPVFKYGFALCAGLFFGYWLYAIFGLEAPGGLTGSLIIWTAIGYFAAQMLLKKSFRVWKAWKGCVALVAVVTLGITVLRLDLMDFAGRVPHPEDVMRVSVDGRGSYPYDDGRSFAVETEDRALIHKTLDLHTALVQEHNSPWTGAYDHSENIRLHVTYELANGSRMSRSYGVNVPLESPLAQTAEAFYCDPALADLAYGLDEIDPQTLLNAELSTLWSTQNQHNTNWNFYGQDFSTTPYLTRQAALLALYDAVRQDFDEGNLGKRYFNNLDAQRQTNTYTADLTLYWTDPDYLKGLDTESVSEDAPYTYHNATSITLTPQAENTLQVLKELGVLNDDHTLRLYQEIVDEEERTKLIYGGAPEINLDPNSASLAIIGGADGPTSILVSE